MRTVLAVTIAALYFCCMAVFGSEGNLETIIVTIDREERPLQGVLGSVDVLRSEQLNLTSPADVSEVLVRVAGVNIARGNGQEYLPALRSPVLSGAGACCGLLTAIDGVATNAAGFCNINELFHANVGQAARVEVIKGPVSAMLVPMPYMALLT